MKQIEADVIVVAAGTAGLAAATAAAENGASVVVFEKANRAGGCGNMANGLFAVESRLQQNMQLPLTRGEIFKYHMNYTHWGVDARLVRAYIDKSAATIDWLEELGVEFVSVESHGIGNHYTWHVVNPPAGAGPMGSGTVMMNILADRARQLGTRILLKTPVRRILKDNGVISGVIARESSGEEIQAKARAVIIATGGFGGNSRWIKKYTGFEWGKDLFSFKIPGLAGDGIRMAWEVGAAESMMTMQVIQQGARIRGHTTLSAFLQPNLVVNLSGERFINEEIIPGNNTFTGNAIALQKNKCAFSIFDEDTKNYYQEKGFDFNTSYGVALMGAITKPVDFDAEMEAALAQKTDGVYVTSSLEELADKAGIEPKTFLKTVEEYNKACETGRDELFDRSPRYLRPVRKPRFYAYRYHLGAFGSLGGIRINYKTEVLNKDHNVIPGLYAAGADANSIYGDTYPITLPGNTMGFAVNSGYIAGENAARYVSGKT